MDLLKQTKKLCNLYNLKPSRSKGQNFLVSSRVYDKIIKEAELNSKDEVLEVGPGLGFLTSRLASQTKRVFSVELDDDLSQVLKIALGTHGIKNVEILNQNVLDLKFPPDNLKGGYKIVANLPYNITSVFLRKVLSAKEKPGLMVLLLQKEVVERIIAKPSQMSLLALSVQYYAQADLVEVVKADNFWPQPKVDSAIVKIKVKDEFPLKPGQEKNFFRLAKFGFSSKRKMLKNNLSGALNIPPDLLMEVFGYLGFNPKIRAQDLSLENWLKLFGALRNYMV